MRTLALDIGERRIGVAISDPGRLLARPHSTLPGGESPAGLARRLRALAAEEGVDEIVIGLPRRLGGEHGPEAERVEELAEKLRQLLPSMTIRLWDERLTTVEAERLMTEAGIGRRRRRERVDRVAAAVILQTYLDHRRAESAEGSVDRPGSGSTAGGGPCDA